MSAASRRLPCPPTIRALLLLIVTVGALLGRSKPAAAAELAALPLTLMPVLSSPATS